MTTKTMIPSKPQQSRKTTWVRTLRQVILASIAVGAAIAIVALLGVEIGDTGVKIIATAFSITGAALVSMPSVAAWERKLLGWLPVAGVAAAVTGFALVIAGTWIEPDSETLWKLPVTLIILAVAIAVTCLLEFARLDARHHWVLTAARLLVGVVATMLIVAIWGEIGDGGYWRGFGVASVLLAAFLASIPVLHRSSRGAESAEFCPLCGATNQAAIGDPTVCSTCDRRYRIVT